LGCTLLNETSAEELKNELPSLELKKAILSDTILWPNGCMVKTHNFPEVDLEKLKKAVDQSFINDDPKHPNNQRAVIVVYKGEIIAEQHHSDFGPYIPQIGWSMSKSIINTMFGVLVQKRGFDIYKPAPIPEWKEANDLRSKITTDQLLRMSSGLEWDEDYTKPSPATKMLYSSINMGKYASAFDAEFDLDTKWYYSSGTSNILSRILRLELGEDYLQWPFVEIFNKIGVTSAIFEVDASNAFVGSSYIWASPRDWARLGLLYANDGVWNGERILPEGWVDYTKTPTPTAKTSHYGAQFWLNAGEADNEFETWLPDCPRDIYSMNGYEGQRVFIIPSKDLIVVTLAQTDKGDFDINAFLAGIVGSVN
jgi:CubicO group peptidase (beta-lactamase class C family)